MSRACRIRPEDNTYKKTIGNRKREFVRRYLSEELFRKNNLKHKALIMMQYAFFFLAYYALYAFYYADFFCSNHAKNMHFDLHYAKLF